MISIRNTAALFLLALALCSGMATAQPTQIFADKAPSHEFVTFAQVQGATLAKVWLDRQPNGTWEVTSNVADVAKASWKADAVCQNRLKTFSVKHPFGENGTKTTSQSLGNTTKTLHGTGTLQSFPLELIRNRCLDIANVPKGGPFKTAVDAPEERAADLAELGPKFNEGVAQTFINGAQHPNSVLLLTAQCTNTTGTKVSLQVSDKEFAPQISFLCCNSTVPSDLCQ